MLVISLIACRCERATQRLWAHRGGLDAMIEARSLLYQGVRSGVACPLPVALSRAPRINMPASLL